jgi:hypothetical protein
VVLWFLEVLGSLVVSLLLVLSLLFLLLAVVVLRKVMSNGRPVVLT